VWFRDNVGGGVVLTEIGKAVSDGRGGNPASSLRI
jgi:hypothetical protein